MADVRTCTSCGRALERDAAHSYPRDCLDALKRALVRAEAELRADCGQIDPAADMDLASIRQRSQFAYGQWRADFAALFAIIDARA